MEKPEQMQLLAALPYSLQGISSAHFQFTDSDTIKLPTTLPIPLIGVLHSLAEPCLLYRKLSKYTQESGTGLVTQSFRAAIEIELHAYLSLVTALETEIRTAHGPADNGEEKRKGNPIAVTLKKCVVWTRDATMSLRLMALLVEESQDKKGGQLISLIHGYSSSHGDPFVGAFAEKLLVHVTKPFYDMLRKWIYEGELTDPYYEFFVRESDPSTQSDVDPRRVQTSIWEHKYILDENMIPTIISTSFAKRIFLIGKSLNFLRHNCGDSDWVIKHAESARKDVRYGDMTALENSIDEAYKTTMTRLTLLMSEKYHLFMHLRALKRYLLLSQGDFVCLLLESLAPQLDRPVYSQYRHNLTSQLEHAIRNSNAQYDDAEVLQRLDARMVELGSGEIGWDSFTLEYKVSAPCDVIITQWAGLQYLKVFNLLWRIKRVEFSLSTTWRRCMTGARGVLSSLEEGLSWDWKRARCAIAEMIHFVSQLQYYILFEVIEASWEQFQVAVNKPHCTLDDLIGAHKTYLDSITRKGLMANTRHGSTSQREDSFLSQLHYIIKTILAYKDTIGGLYSYSVAEFSRKQELSAKVDQRTAQGKWGFTERDLQVSNASQASTPISRLAKPLMPSNFGTEPTSPTATMQNHGGGDTKLLASLRSRLAELSADFGSRVNILLYDLAHQPDADLQFLGVVMNFNESYDPVNAKRQAVKVKETRQRKENPSGGAKIDTI